MPTELYTIELRATPDTDDIEVQHIKSVGGQAAPQTVIYKLHASSCEEACRRAIETESSFTHRRPRTLTIESKRGKITYDLVSSIWVHGTLTIKSR